MVLPVSGFLPVPLPMMIPFMGAQSLVIGKMFGEGFQYGKRKISAMSNEEFNKLTFQDMMSNARTEMQASIPTMQAALADMQPMVQTVVHEFIDYIKLVKNQAEIEIQEAVITPAGGAGTALAGPLLGPQLGELLNSISRQIQQAVLPQAFGSGGSVTRTTKEIIAADVAQGAQEIPPGYTMWKGKLVRVERLQELINAKKGAQQRLTVREQVRGVSPIIPLGERKRKPSTSIRMERTKLKKEIVHINNLLRSNSNFRRGYRPSGNTIAARKNQQMIHQKRLTRALQELSSLQARFDWT